MRDDTLHSAQPSSKEATVLASLPLLDRLLPLGILLAMASVLLLGRLVPGIQAALTAVQVDHSSLPIAIGLLLMMYPVLAKVRYGELGQVLRVALPLLLYFVLMWSTTFALGKRSGLDYPRTSALAFTAAGNNFELAIVVCISIWGISSQQALAGVIGPVIEVPVLVSLVYVSLWLKQGFRVSS